MKQLVKVEEVENEGLISMLEKNVLLFCGNYIYSGKLAGVNNEFVKLLDGGIVYETGPFNGKLKDFQKMPNAVYIQKNAIESYTLL